MKAKFHLQNDLSGIYCQPHHLTAAKFAHCLDKNNSCSRQPQFMEIKHWESSIP